MQLRYPVLAAAVFVSLCLVAYFQPGQAGTQADAPLPAAPSVAVPRDARPVAAVAVAPGSPQPPSPVKPSLASQIDSLIAAGKPEQAYAAYILISDCATFNRDHERAIFDLAEVTSGRSMMPYRGMNDAEKRDATALCSGMTERMRLSRLDYLATAVQGKVPGAIIRMADEGPFGDRSALSSRPDDPLVKEWKRTVTEQLIAAAEQGDLGVLGDLWIRQSVGDPLLDRNPALAYRYALAQGLVLSDLAGPDNALAKMYAVDGALTRSIKGLSEEQRTAELAEAQRIAAVARAQRERNKKAR